MTLRGRVTIDGEVLEPGALLYLGTGRSSLHLACDDAAQMLRVGGEPFGEEILLWWNFVARTQEDLHTASADWNAGRRFGEVKGSPSPRLVAPDISTIRLKKP